MTQPLDCACVIHGDLYAWDYVQRLYNMVLRHVDRPLRFHVFTEAERPVPPPMIRHDLTSWPGISGRKKAWWYKLQMFDPRHQLGELLYFDLDVVIVRPLHWISALDPAHFWTVRDFKHLWRPAWQGANTSIMYWNTQKFHDVWRDFSSLDINTATRQWPGDQDYITHFLGSRMRFMPAEKVLSWRWQIKDAGMDFKTRCYRRPDAGSVLTPETSVMIFHGRPKPHEVQDTVISSAWR